MFDDETPANLMTTQFCSLVISSKHENNGMGLFNIQVYHVIF